MFYDPQDKLGKFCPLCFVEHFNEGELCTRCTERLSKIDGDDYED